jgi:hypothetical protein
MSSWTDQYNAVFFISIATITTGLIGLSIKYCLKSKCEKFSLCFGLFEIKRRVDLEVQEEMAQMELGMYDNDDEVKTEQPINRKKSKKNNIEDKEDDIV